MRYTRLDTVQYAQPKCCFTVLPTESQSHAVLAIDPSPLSEDDRGRERRRLGIGTGVGPCCVVVEVKVKVKVKVKERDREQGRKRQLWQSSGSLLSASCRLMF